MVTYDYYRVFYHVALYCNFSKAAEVLGNNQPNITRYINNLEHQLECKLFVRNNRGVSLTPEGERLFSHVSIAYKQLMYGEEELKKDRSLKSGVISMGISDIALHLLALDKLESFHETYPDVQLRISAYSSPEAVTALKNGLVDFAVVTSPISVRKPFEMIVLSSFREILLGGPKYESLAVKENRLCELAEYPLRL